MRVAVDEGVVVGFATITAGADAWELDDLFVAPAHMRRGFATALVRHLLAEADVAAIEVTANPHAMAFYRSVGFVDDGVARDAVRARAEDAAQRRRSSSAVTQPSPMPSESRW